MAPLFEGEENTNYGLYVGPLSASVSVAVLVQDYGGANGTLGEVVLEGHAGLVQKGEEFIVVAPETFNKGGALARPPKARR